jgi:protoheme IX farnesyltransferase
MTPRASATATAVVAPASKTAGPERTEASRRASNTLADYVNLTKPRLNALVIASSAAGYYLGAHGRPDAWLMAEAVVGTTFVAAGAAVLNQVSERDTDRLMRRTRFRPLPDGRVGLADAGVFGAALSLAGLALLATRASAVAAGLALATLVVYLAIYTPMKRRTSLATLVGAVPGALPPLIGWAAAHGATSGLDAGGAALFAIVFLWQIPHFMAISWLYRDDYANAGFPLLPVIDPDGGRAGRQAFIYAMALLPASLTPALAGVAGAAYVAIATVLGAALLALSWRFAVARTDRTARALFLGSIVYLPLLWIAMIVNHS